MKELDIVIETPKLSTEKYSFDKVSGFFKIKKILPAGLSFPYDFGFIPKTMGEDGDPLDIIVISEYSTFPGCMVTCRIIGGIKANQTEEDKTIRNDRFIGIPTLSHAYQKVKSLKDLDNKLIKDVENFFIAYNSSFGKIFTPLAHLRSDEALEIIAKQMQEN